MEQSWSRHRHGMMSSAGSGFPRPLFLPFHNKTFYQVITLSSCGTLCRLLLPYSPPGFLMGRTRPNTRTSLSSSSSSSYTLVGICLENGDMGQSLLTPTSKPIWAFFSSDFQHSINHQHPHTLLGTDHLLTYLTTPFFSPTCANHNFLLSLLSSTFPFLSN